MIAPRFGFAVNTAGRNKDWDFRKLSGRFRDRTGTLADVIHHVQQGHALCTARLGGQWRSKDNFVSSQWILSEIDNSGLLRDETGNVVIDADGKGVKVYEHQLTIEEALEHPFVKAHCALIYTTPSHRPDWHRFRLVWLLPEVVIDIDTYEVAIRLVLAQVPHDPACKDGVRVFYGNTNAEFPLINPDAVLPHDWIDLAIDIAQQEKQDRAEREQLQALKRNQFRQLAQDEGWDTEALILQALSFIPPRSIGGGNYHECAPVLMALADHYGTSEAARIAEQWSPSIKGSTWNIGQKLKSFRRSGITIGTLFYIALKHGFKFPERRKPLPVGEPDAAAYNAYRDWEDEQERITAAIDKERSFERLLKLFGQKKRVQIERVIALQATPPTPAHEYAAGDRLATWGRAIEQNYRYILDQSGTGTGKSFDSGKLEPHSFGAKQAIYLSPQHRNPTVETLTADNGWIDLEARHAGLTREATPGGGHRLKRTGKGEIPTVPANCNRTGIINALRGKHVQGADTASLICGTCSLKEACQNTVRGGYGFLNQRQSALSAPKLRAHPDSLPSPDGYPIDEAILLHDEAGETFTTKRDVVVTMQDVAQTIAALLKAGVLESVQALLTILLNHLDGTTKAGRYGLNHTEAVKRLGDVQAIDIAAIEQILQPDLSFLNTTAEYGVDLADLPPNLRKKFADRDRNGASTLR